MVPDSDIAAHTHNLKYTHSNPHGIAATEYKPTHYELPVVDVFTSGDVNCHCVTI
jgi:hypothetical protein